ncbi:MAG: class I SAM-dependent methyltransferase [Alicyclobacillus sp.]|nr:class I SAM-dependent methyltransferase [Alicyclobacillus sp.]
MDYQDALAELGAAVAHPGGLQSTHVWTTAIPWDPAMRVLEVGCGTGRTAVWLAEQWGCSVTGIDIRKKMVEQARRRAKQAGVSAQFRVGRAEAIPFRAETFEVVYTESVNVFVDAALAVKEYMRVLKPGGWYADVEMFVRVPVDESWRASVRRVYGARWVPDLTGWKRLFLDAGFRSVQVLESRPVRPEAMLSEAAGDTAWAPATPPTPRILQVLRDNAEWMEQYASTLGYAVVICRK